MDNLKVAVEGETHEFKHMYPEMIADAKEEGNKTAERSFVYANEVEQVHAKLYQNAMDNLDSLEEVDYHVCSVCGMTVEDEAPDNCPVCGAPASAFFKVD
jgi:rubrerythrin